MTPSRRAAGSRHAPDGDNLSDELADALELLESRFRRDLVAQWDAGDFAANLLRHLRTRTEPRLLFSPENLPRLSTLARQHDPDEFAWEKEIADNAVAGRMYGASNAYCRRFLAVDRHTFDFSSYDHPDPETIHGLTRHRWYASLARHYWDDGDPAYFDALMDQWDFFVAKVPFAGEAFLRNVHAIGPTGMQPPWGELDIDIRLTNWWWAYWVILHAEQMTPQRNAILLARCLRLFDLVAARGIKHHEHNFTSMQMESVYFWATALPEVTGMDVWRHAARNTMEASLGRAVFDDGVHWEKSAGYHRGCIRWYGTSYLLGRVNGRPWADPYGQRLRRMGEFLDAVVTPDGLLSLLSDSDRDVSWRAGLTLLKCIFPDMTFRRPVAPTHSSLWASDGFEWDPADTVGARPTVSVFPNGGVAVVHHPAPELGAMVILDNGPTHAGHSHKDNLTIHYEAFARPIVVDPGRWVYRGGADRAWVVACQSHNTAYIEDEPVHAGDWIRENALEVITTCDDPRVSPMHADRRDDRVVLRTRFKGFVADPDACVTRVVVFPVDGADVWLLVHDTIEGHTAHTWTNSWLFPTDDPVEQIDGACRVRLDHGMGVWLVWAAATPLDLRDDAMFWCPQYGEKSPARWVRFSGSCTTATRAFLFLPHTHETSAPTIRLEPQNIGLTINGTPTSVPIDPPC